MKLNEVLKKDYDTYTMYLTENFDLFIQLNNGGELCIELTDHYGESKNINGLLDISLDNDINDIRESLLNAILDKLMYCFIPL